jgi:hypothetical protein
VAPRGPGLCLHRCNASAARGLPSRGGGARLGILVRDRGVLREDRDAARLLQRVAIHDALRVRLALAEDAALREHAVHERRLAVVDVRDDRDVADGVALLQLVVRAHVRRANLRCTTHTVQRQRWCGTGKQPALRVQHAARQVGSSSRCHRSDGSS